MQGATGASGSSGPPGPSGPSGDRGQAGDKGSVGPQGAAGMLTIIFRFGSFFNGSCRLFHWLPVESLSFRIFI